MNGKYGLAIALGIVIVCVSCGEAEAIDVTWTNPNIDANAGDWFDPNNWSGGVVPDISLSAGIVNGGEAHALDTTAAGPITARELHIGTDFSGRMSVIGVDADIARDLHVARAINANSGEGTLTINASDQVEIGGTFFAGTVVGPAGGFAIANVNINASTFDVGGDLIVAKSENTVDSFIFSTTFFSRGRYRIGFANPSLPGNVEVSTVIAPAGMHGAVEAGLILTNSQFEVAGDIVVGRLEGGSAEASLGGGSIQSASTYLSARNVRLGQRLDDTAGSVSGAMFLTRSLWEVAEEIQFSEDSLVQFTIPGLVRADGTGGADHYSAINASSASLAGRLLIDTTTSYNDPSSAGTVDTFQLLVTDSGGTGSFEVIRYDGDQLEADFGSLAFGFRDHIDDGLFRILGYDEANVVLQNYRALPGDANGDFVVDGADFLIWNSHKFTASNGWTSADFNGDGVTDGQDFVIWNDHKFTSVTPSGNAVPEPFHLNGIVTFALLLLWRRIR